MINLSMFYIVPDRSLLNMDCKKLSCYFLSTKLALQPDGSNLKSVFEIH